jgi:hypothetical protein
MFFPVLNHFSIEFTASPTENCILSNTTLEFFKLMLNFLTFCLFFIKFSLQLTRHAIISVLSFFKIESHLMYVRQRV